MYRTVAIAWVALGCGALPDFGGAEMVACEALPDTECISYEERVCGWRRADEVNVVDPAHADFVSEGGTRFEAPEGRCARVTKSESGRLAAPGSHPCEVEGAARCVVLMPGDSVESFQRVDAGLGGGGFEVADLDASGACPFSCE